MIHIEKDDDIEYKPDICFPYDRHMVQDEGLQDNKPERVIREAAFSGSAPEDNEHGLMPVPSEVRAGQ